MSRVFLLGANGFSAQLIGSQLTQEKIPFVAVARDEQKIGQIVNELHWNCETLHLESFLTLAQHLGPGDFVINTVGPYKPLSQVFLPTILNKKITYLDITGEQEFVKWTHTQSIGNSWPARIVQSCAFESFFADLLFEKILSQNDSIQSLESTYLTYPMRPSPGTLATLQQSHSAAQWILKNGQLLRAPSGTSLCPFSMDEYPTINAITPVAFPEVLFAKFRNSKRNVASFSMGQLDQLRNLVAFNKMPSLKNSTPEMIAPRPERVRVHNPFSERFKEVQYAVTAAGYGCATGQDLETSQIAWRISGSDPYFASACIVLECLKSLLSSKQFESGYQTPAQLFDESVLQRVLIRAQATLQPTQIRSGDAGRLAWVPQESISNDSKA